MALVKKLASAQTVLAAVFTINYNDTMVNTAAATTAFGVTGTTKYDIFTPPPGAIVIGGVVKVETVAAGGTSTIDIGDSDDEDRYTETAAVDLADPDAPATGFEQLGDHKVYTGAQAIRITIANSAGLTALKAHVVVNFVVPGRASENLKTT
jgi:hypothetical protein